jgi:hypothetical protein
MTDSQPLPKKSLLVDFIIDHVKHFAALPCEYEDEHGNVYDWHSYWLILDDKEN